METIALQPSYHMGDTPWLPVASFIIICSPCSLRGGGGCFPDAKLRTKEVLLCMNIMGLSLFHLSTSLFHAAQGPENLPMQRLLNPP